MNPNNLPWTRGRSGCKVSTRHSRKLMVLDTKKKDKILLKISLQFSPPKDFRSSCHWVKALKLSTFVSFHWLIYGCRFPLEGMSKASLILNNGCGWMSENLRIFTAYLNDILRYDTITEPVLNRTSVWMVAFCWCIYTEQHFATLSFKSDRSKKHSCVAQFSLSVEYIKELVNQRHKSFSCK